MRLRESPSEQIGQSVQIVAWWAVGMGAVVSLISPVALRPVLERHGIVDRPNERSSHLDPTLRAGGIAPLAGFALFAGIATWFILDSNLLLIEP